MQKTQDEIKATVKFVKLCLKDAGYSKELITFLFSTYDLNEFIGTHKGNKYEIASGFLNHASQIFYAANHF
jgi:hypothetical protein